MFPFTFKNIKIGEEFYFTEEYKCSEAALLGEPSLPFGALSPK